MLDHTHTDEDLFTYRKILKISPGAYILQRPFLRGLFLEGLIFGGAYLRREICVSKSIGLALYIVGRKFTVFSLFYLYLRAIFQFQAPKGAYIWRGDLPEGFLRYRLEGLIFGILRYFRASLTQARPWGNWLQVKNEYFLMFSRKHSTQILFIG